MTRPLVLAAGGVLWRGDPEAPELALVHRPAYDDWSLPKGKAKPGEHLLVTALREVSEETGQRAVIGPLLTTVRYRVTAGGRPADKVVTYWSMRRAGGTFVTNKEVDELRWLGLAAARRQLTSASDRAVLDAFVRSARDTRPLVLVRNAASDDQADALVPVLQGLGVTALVSADLASCLETFAPTAAAVGLRVREEPGLGRAEFEGNGTAVAADLRREMRTQEIVAVCAQQQVISALLEHLGRGDGVRPPAETSLRKGGWWLLHVRDGAVSAYERHEPAA
jgi:8-oxo-dGTP diphosphatase